MTNTDSRLDSNKEDVLETWTDHGEISVTLEHITKDNPSIHVYSLTKIYILNQTHSQPQLLVH